MSKKILFLKRFFFEEFDKREERTGEEQVSDVFAYIFSNLSRIVFLPVNLFYVHSNVLYVVHIH
jgi:hypothetical protein